MPRFAFVLAIALLSTPAPQPATAQQAGPGAQRLQRMTQRVRYPVEIENAGDIDDRIAAAVTEAMKT